MHTVSEVGTNVPAFLGKLWKLVEDPETDDLICWAPNGRSFFIRNQAQFAHDLLPHYYKHNNMASFVRQLNMYGFHKKVSVDLGGLKCDKDEMEFAHQFFCKDHAYLLDHIKRKIASTKTQDPAVAPMKPELMSKMLTEVRSMRGRQENLDSRLVAMKRENEALWRELAMLRQKHLKQQNIVNKLIHFLVTLVQPNRNSGLSVKRRLPLMIGSHKHHSKQSKLSKSHASPGPVIHELDASDPDVDSEYIVAEMLENPTVESPEHQSTYDDDASCGDLEVDNETENAVLLEEEETCYKRYMAKNKKKRKNKVPIKVIIPTSENGEEPREETVMLEVPIEEIGKTFLKPVPVSMIRSSKLAAMAANMNKSNAVNMDFDLDTDYDEEYSSDDPSLVKLENMLNDPNIIQNETEQTDEITQTEGDGNAEVVEEVLQDSITNQVIQDSIHPEEELVSQNDASTSAVSKDLSLRCVNPNALSQISQSYGLPRKDMDSHVETMATELENLRDALHEEGYVFDANTLLGLFGSDDPMSFGIPTNPDLDPHEDTTKNVGDQELNNDQNKGELMAYNSPNFLDFDEMFLNPSNLSPAAAPSEMKVSLPHVSKESELLLDDKGALLDALIAANNANSDQA